MKKTAVVTDTSGMSIEEAKALGAFILPMSFTIDGIEYKEGVGLSDKDFYEKMEADAEIFTSQPSAGDVMDLWDEVLKEYDELIHIPISSGLSGSYNNALIYAEDYDGRVVVADAQRVSVPMRAAVEDAIMLASKGYAAKEICHILEGETENSAVYILMDTLKYLKKGGRITPAAAAIGTVLQIKPVLQVHGKTLDSYVKVRSVSKGKKAMFQALEKEMERMGITDLSQVRIQAACSYGFDGQQEWVAQLEEHFKGAKVEYGYLPLNLTCHIGPNAMGAGITKRILAEEK